MLYVRLYHHREVVGTVVYVRTSLAVLGQYTDPQPGQDQGRIVGVRS